MRSSKLDISFIFTLSISLLVGFSLPILYNSISTARSIDKIYDPSKNSFKQEKTELVLIYIGNSECPAANHQLMPESVKTIKNKLKTIASVDSIRFVSIGIANENIRPSEFEHLSKFGKFDEIIIGNDWSNSGVLKYVYDNFNGPSATPQVIISLRTFNNIGSEKSAFYRGISSEMILHRRIGVKSIVDLAMSDQIITQDYREFLADH